jgi:uncharacterized integral membrane protein (TIGR00697 family)
MAEVLSLSTLIVCFITILGMLKFFGKSGLYVYSTIALIASNIQVLKLTKYAFASDPVALGTVLFSTTFAIDNILNEYFGEKIAKKCVWISFWGYLFFVIVMKISVLHPAIEHSECTNLYAELDNLFSPTLVLFASSLVSYLVSQYTDIFIFSALKKKFRGKSKRAMISMGISTFVDNCVFSVLAWIIFADKPISLSSLWSTYIFITYITRLIIAVLCVPLVRLSGKFITREQNVQEF